ncbi:MAG: DNA polymerase I [Ruminococcaceae bacterium]|nr:DNA polymerase I [Oscillospiraceae bacterium]
MKLLVIDGNSILNRAYYGVRLLSTKDGRFTNGIYGFLNIFLSLLGNYEPDAVAVAFDLKAPTFRHKMYSDYKAGRKPAPRELVEQFAPLKELLTALGYTVVEKEGYEADDILGTLSASCKEDDFCYIATGDRDSLQLVKENVNVVLASTKAGQPVSTVYDIDKIKEEYLVTPKQMIDIKAIQGDSSDNIPGVAGIGPKGAIDLISKFESVENIYENLENLDIKAGTKVKLEASKESAFLSKTLGTICLEAPISTNLEDYKIKSPDREKAKRLFASLEMFKHIKRFNLDEDDAIATATPSKEINVFVVADYSSFLNELEKTGKAYFITKYNDGGIEYIFFMTDKGVAIVENADFMFMSFAKEFLCNPKIQKYTDNAKHLFAFCEINGFSAENIKLDTSLAGYLLNPNSSDYSVATLSEAYGLEKVKVKADSEEVLSVYEEEKVNIKSAAVMESLSLKLMSAITENNQEKLLYEIEIPLARVLASMEREGFSVDKEGIVAYGEKLANIIEVKLGNIYALAGCEFNVNSPKQLGEVLFSEDKLNLPHQKKTKSGYSTNAEVLEFLKDKHPIIPEILEYRTLSKLKSTYCDGLLKVIDNDGRIHSTLNQTETRTGRISSTEPNLQNIPVRTELGRELRRFFNAKDGFVLVDADYSQIELRVLAAMAEDEMMKKAFIENLDIHTATASQVFSVPMDKVTSDDRRKAKAVNFGIVYGIGAFSLSNDIGTSVQEADRYIKGYLANYSGVAAFMEKCKADAKSKGYAETVFGRRRYLPELTSSNANLRNFGERVSMNMPIQGTAADIIKIAMIKVWERLKKEVPEAHLIMQVHDELIIEAPESKQKEVSLLLKQEMENAVTMSVPFLADVNCGKTWYDAK